MHFGAVVNLEHECWEEVVEEFRSQGVDVEEEHKKGKEKLYLRLSANVVQGESVSQSTKRVWAAIGRVEASHKLQQALLEKEYAEGKVEVFPLIELAQRVGVFEDVFPLHDEDSTERKKTFHLTMKSWLRLPVEEVRKYFGEEVGFYFAFMEFSTLAYLIPALVGSWMWWFRPKGITVDNSPFIPFFSLLVAIWTTLVAVFWHRKSCSLAHKWKTDNPIPTLPVLRPNFRGIYKKSPITGEMERWYGFVSLREKNMVFRYPDSRRRLWQLFSVVVTFVMLVIALTAMLLSMNLQGYMVNKESPFYVDSISQYAAEGSIFDPNGEGFLWLIPVITHSIFIFLLNSLYRVIAEHLTELENYRTEEEHKNALIIKRFLFEFLDCFSPLFYIAIYRQDITLLRMELIALYTSDELRRTATESFLPWILQVMTMWWDRRKIRKAKQEDGHVPGPVELQSAKDEYEIFDDYLEMVIQMGYVSLFASAFPLAAVLSVASNLIEIRSDSFKLVHVTRRPHAEGVSNIGPWANMLDILCYAAIPSNVFLFAFSSDQMMAWFPTLFGEGGVMKMGMGRWVMGLSVGLEHVLLLIVILLRHLIPKVPAHVRLARHKKIHALQKE